MRLRDGDVDLTSGVVERGSGSARLTPLELKLLQALVRHSPAPVGKDQLLDEVWGYSTRVTRTVTVTVQRLRVKIERNPNQPEIVCSVRGRGYRFVPVTAPEKLTAEQAHQIVQAARSGLVPLSESDEAALVALCGGIEPVLRAAAPVVEWVTAPEELLALPAGDSTVAEHIAALLPDLSPDLLRAGSALAIGVPVAALAPCFGPALLSPLALLREAGLLRDTGLIPIAGAWFSSAHPLSATDLARIDQWLADLPCEPFTLLPVYELLIERVTKAALPQRFDLVFHLLEVSGDLGTLQRGLDLTDAALIDVPAGPFPLACRVLASSAAGLSRVLSDDELSGLHGDDARLALALATYAIHHWEDDGPGLMDAAIASVQGKRDAFAVNVLLLAGPRIGRAAPVRGKALLERAEALANERFPMRALCACTAMLRVDTPCFDGVRRAALRLEGLRDTPENVYSALYEAQLGLALLELGELGEAEQRLQRTLPLLERLQPEFAQQMRVRAGLYSLASPELARNWLPDPDSGHPDGRSLTRWALAALDGGPFPESEADFGEAFRSGGPIPPCRHRHILKLAIEFYRRAVA